MRKFKPVFLLLALLTGAAFAAEVGVSSRASSSSDDVARAATTRTTANRVTASRNVPNATNASSGNSVTTRTTVSRATVNRGTATNSNTTRSTVSRSNVSGASRGTVSRASTNQTKTANTTRNVSGDINANPAVRRAGVTLRPSFADYGGRATIAGTGTMTGSNIRSDIQKLSGRAAKNVTATAESIVGTRETLERTSELNKSCQEQYNECMDQFCAVIDANQKRCSCSSNLSRYTKVEKAVTDANNKLNEVAQTIRYVGLSADEIRAIMSETEAEEALRDSKDNSATRNMLKQIESMIKDPTSRTNNYVSEMDFGLDMDLTFSSDPVDIFNLDFLNLGTNSNTISNLRGTELYRTAKKRCNTILTRCKEAGATQDQIVGNYDLAIDKDCIEYEAGLTKMNETLLANVKSANLMLQKARLAVNQNQNQYDALGCVAALENCMKDDMVCGDDYLQCVDPTKAYIDENGEVVMGQDITVIQSFMTDYNNAVLDKSYLQSAYNTRIGVNSCGADGKCVVKYLLQKIGTKQKTVDEGLCRAVLDRCQNYTYDKDKKYKPYNDIVINYLQRAMVSIKAAQQRIISDYASNCITDVAACYSQQVSQISGLTTAASKSDVKSVMRGACRSIALTCGFAIFTGKPEIDPNVPMYGTNYTVSDCKYITGPDVTNVPEYGSATYNNAIINCVSDMFYDSLLSSLDSSSSSSGSSSGGNNGTTNTTYTVTYTCGDGATGSSWTQTGIAANQSIQLPADPTGNQCTAQAGKAFGGWNVNGTTTNAGNSITVSGTMTISAVWVEGKYTLAFSCGDGAQSTTGSQTWTVENAPATYTLPADPTTDANKHCIGPTDKPTFAGWLVGENTEAIAAGQPVTLAANTNITATWAAGNYTVTFNANNATGEPNPASIQCVTGQNCACAKVGNMVRTGYRLVGWDTNQNATSATYPLDNNGVGNCQIQNGQNTTFTTLYAVWLQNGAVAVSYNCDNAGQGSASPTQNGTVLAGQSMTVAKNSCTRTGYTLANNGQWSVYVNGNETSVGMVFGESPYQTDTSTTSVIFKATWTAKTFTINYDCGEGTGAVSPGTATYGSSFTPETSGCSKTGYSFAGWQISGQNEIYNSAFTWNFDSTGTEFTLIAQYGQGDAISCPSGQYLPAGSTTCAPCPAGYMCTGVNNGFYNANNNQGRQQCGVDQVQPDTGKSSCNACDTSAQETQSTTPSTTNTATCPDGTTSKSNATGTKQSYKKVCAYTGTNTEHTECIYKRDSECTKDYTGQTCYVTGCATNYHKNSDETECVADQYTVTYDCNGGNGTAPANQTANVNTEITLAAGSSCGSNGTKAFLGWKINGNTYTKFTGDSATTYTAVAEWGNATISLSWNNGGHGTVPSSASTSCTIGGSFTTPTAPTGGDTDKYDFRGWYANGNVFNGGSTYSNDFGCSVDVLGTSPVELVALWTPKTYDITYNNMSTVIPQYAQLKVIKSTDAGQYIDTGVKFNATKKFKVVGSFKVEDTTANKEKVILSNSGSNSSGGIFDIRVRTQSGNTGKLTVLGTLSGVYNGATQTVLGSQEITELLNATGTDISYEISYDTSTKKISYMFIYKQNNSATTTIRKEFSTSAITTTSTISNETPLTTLRMFLDYTSGNKTPISIGSTTIYKGNSANTALELVANLIPASRYNSQSNYTYGMYDTKATSNQFKTYASGVFVAGDAVNNNTNTPVPAKYTYGVGATVAAGTPTKIDGVYTYNFVGWCTDSGLSSCATTQTISASDTGVKEYWPKWNTLYKVTYYCGTGSDISGNPPSPQTGLAGNATITVAGNDNSNPCYRTNYTWNGWNTSPTGDGTGYNYKDDNNVTQNTTLTLNNENVALYAQWKGGADASQITIHYRCSSFGGGYNWDVQTNQQNIYLLDNSTAKSKCSISDNRTLQSWYCNSSQDSSSYTPGSSTSSTVDLTCEAVWSPYTITYSCGEGTTIGSAWTETRAATSIDLPNTTNIYQHCTGPNDKPIFNLWWKEGAGSSHNAGATNVAISGDTTFTAKWKAGYTVMFNSNDASGNPSPSKVVCATNSACPTFPSQGAMTKPGYEFKGWSESSSATTATYAAGDTPTVTKNMTLYAVWTSTSGGSDIDECNSITIGTKTAYVGCDGGECAIYSDQSCSTEVYYLSNLSVSVSSGQTYARQGVCCADSDGKIIPYEYAPDCYEGTKWTLTDIGMCDMATVE